MVFPEKKNYCFPNNLDSSPHVYYSRVMGYFYREKLKRLCGYLDKNNYKQILDVGFGSGVALKELSLRADKVVGIDVHNYIDDVKKMIDKEGITNVFLQRHDIFKEPLEEELEFDCIFSSSVLEHMTKEELSVGLKNIYDKLESNGCFLVGFPLKTVFMNSFFLMYEKLFKKFRKDSYDFVASCDHPSGEMDILPEIEKLFMIEKKEYLINKFFKIYLIMKCKKI